MAYWQAAPMSSGTRFEAKPLRAAEHLGDADRRRPELMTDLLRIDPDALETQQHDQSGKTRFWPALIP